MWTNPQKTAGLVTFTEEIFHGKLHIFCSDKTKSQNENTTNEYRYFIESSSVGINRLFVLIYSNQDGNEKSFIYQKVLSKIKTSLSTDKTFIHSHIKPYEEIKKLITGQGEDYDSMFVRLWIYQKSL